MNTGALILLSNLIGACPALVDVRIAVVPSHTPLAAWFLLTSLLAASATDLHRFRIPNWITYPTIAAGLGISTASDLIDQFRSDWLIDSFGLVSARDSILGCLTGFAVMLLAYVLTGRGAGDVKLAGAIGAFLGPNAALSVILWTHLIAGIFAIALVIHRVGPLRLSRFGMQWIGSCIAPSKVPLPVWQPTGALAIPVPMAGFFLLGTLIVLRGM